MKKISWSAILLLLVTVSVGQQPAALTKEDYLQKSQNRKTAGWALLGGGTALMITGGVLVSSSLSNLFSNENNSNGDIGGVLFITGLLADLGSIPLFISSSNNARKAARLSFENQPVVLPVASGILLRPLPSVTLTWTLGRQ